MTTPNYLAATTGIAAAAGQANQFLGTHTITYLYAAVLQGSQSTDGSASIGISGTPPTGGFTRLAQQVATASGQTAIGYYVMNGEAVGNGCDLTATLYTNSSSTTGTQIGSTAVTIPAEFWTSGSVGATFWPLPISGLTASTTYQLVLTAGDVNGNHVGDASNYIALEKSNQSSGAAAYAASTWTAEAYGFMFGQWDQTVAGQLTMIWEDSGSRWTYLDWSSGVLTGINEYTISQGTGKMRSVRVVTASGILLTSVA